MGEGELSAKTVTDASAALSARDAVARLLNASQSGTLNDFQGAARHIGEGQDLSRTVAEVRDANGRGPLHFAARGGNLEVCKYIVENLQLPIDQRDNDGETPLIHAARLGHYDTAKYLVEHGADVSAASSDLGTAPLHHAAGIGSTELIRLFLENGANVNAETTSGTPLIWAAGHGNSDAVKVLLQNQANPNTLAENDVSALISGAAAGSYDVVRLLVEHGADVNVSAGGVTALHVAADSGDEKMVKFLLEAGANPDAKDEEGAKPIQAAAARNHCATVELLLPLTSPDPDSTWTVDGIVAGQQVAPKTEKLSREMQEKAAEAKARGSEAFKRRDYLLAIDAYTQALDLDPMNAPLYANRSMCWVRTGQPEQALKDAKTAVVLKPDWSKAHYREGVALRLLQRFDEAANAFYEGIKLEPQSKELIDAFRETVESGKQYHASKATNQEETSDVKAL